MNYLSVCVYFLIQVLKYIQGCSFSIKKFRSFSQLESESKNKNSRGRSRNWSRRKKNSESESEIGVKKVDSAGLQYILKMPITKPIAVRRMAAKTAIVRRQQQRCVVKNVGPVLNYHMLMLQLEKFLRRNELTFALCTCLCCFSLLEWHSKYDNIIE